MAKKKKREVAKRHSRAKGRLKRKRKLRLVKPRPKPNTQILYRPSLPHMGAPEGFRSISMSQAIMEYTKPIMKFVEDNENDLDNAMQISMVLWNYSVSIERGNEYKGLEKKILKGLKKTFGMDKDESHDLLKKMVERYSYLFPKDIQPKAGMPFMFIRKELKYLIKPYDYNKLTLSSESIPPDQDDRDLINKIERN